ncbi:MAG: hypothetical protein F6K37_17360 [Moorea sp. SIO4E2]|nr:hypothetical protein [Moorena sp. SIO4E2]NEQ07643.1 hypothetical protein [Moorena sp. SIO4E2]
MANLIRRTRPASPTENRKRTFGILPCSRSVAYGQARNPNLLRLSKLG